MSIVIIMHIAQN